MRASPGRASRATSSATTVLIGAILLLVGLSGCASSTVFEPNQNTLYLKAATYAVIVATECGTPIATVVTDITSRGWSYPLLNGTPLTIPTSGDYTVNDEIGSDLMLNEPACSMALRIALTPVHS